MSSADFSQKRIREALVHLAMQPRNLAKSLSQRMAGAVPHSRTVMALDGQWLKLPGIVPKLSGTPGATKWVGPELGEHTAEVLSALGYSDAQQKELKKRGII